MVIPATSSRDGGHILGTQLAPAANSPGVQEEEEEEQKNGGIEGKRRRGGRRRRRSRERLLQPMWSSC